MIAESEGETFHGHEGVKRWWEVVRNAFTDVRWGYSRFAWAWQSRHQGLRPSDCFR
jgi:hypothetical protein